MLAGANQSTLPVLILSVNRTGITPDINALTTVMVLVDGGGHVYHQRDPALLKNAKIGRWLRRKNARLMQAKN